jgi:hypothetical protein
VHDLKVDESRAIFCWIVEEITGVRIAVGAIAAVKVPSSKCRARLLPGISCVATLRRPSAKAWKCSPCMRRKHSTSHRCHAAVSASAWIGFPASRKKPLAQARVSGAERRRRLIHSGQPSRTSRVMEFTLIRSERQAAANKKFMRGESRGEKRVRQSPASRNFCRLESAAEFLR